MTALVFTLSTLIPVSASAQVLPPPDDRDGSTSQKVAAADGQPLTEAQIEARIDRLLAVLDVLEQRIDPVEFDVDARARQLGRDPEAIFAFVRDQVRFEPYYGLLRGARGTLMALAGNSLDQSILLGELLEKAGFTVRIASGELGSEQLELLLDQFFEESPPADWSPDRLSAEEIQAVATAAGAEPAELAADLQQQYQTWETVQEDFWDAVEDDYTFITGMLEQAGAELGSDDSGDPYADLVREIQEHFWVQYRDRNGSWADLDPSFRGADPGEAMASSNGHFAPVDLPDNLSHTLTIAVNLETDPAVGSSRQAQATTSSELLLEHRLRAADIVGVRVAFTNIPDLSEADLLNPDLPIERKLEKIREFTPALVVAGQVHTDQSFDLQGNTFTAGGAPGQAGRTIAKGFGSAAQGLDAIPGGLQAGDAGQARVDEIRVIGQTIEYVIASPRPAGDQPQRRSYRRRLPLAPALHDQPHVEPQKMPRVPLDEVFLKLPLLRTLEIVAPVGPIPQSYATYGQIAAHKHAVGMLKSAMNAENGARISAPYLGTADVSLLAYLFHSSRAVATLAQYRFPSLTRSHVRPGLVVYEYGLHVQQDGGVIGYQGYDIIDNNSARAIAMSFGSEHPGYARSSSRMLSMYQGIVDTNTERMLLEPKWDNRGTSASKPGAVANASSLFAAAGAPGVDVVVLGADESHDGRVLATLPFSAAIKAEISMDIEHHRFVIIPTESIVINGVPRVGWWRIDKSNGSVLGIVEGKGASFTNFLILTLSITGCVVTVAKSDAHVVGKVAGYGFCGFGLFFWGVGLGATATSGPVEIFLSNVSKVIGEIALLTPTIGLE